MKSIRHIATAFLCLALVLGVTYNVDAQTKKKKTTTTASSKKKSTKKKAEETPAPPKLVELPYNSNDCIFAIPLEIDKEYGPTTAPYGGGRVQEIVADKQHPNLFAREHNTVWYKVTIPYNGELEIDITQENVWDDYDFLVYKNTGIYFSNQVIMNKVSPVGINLSAVDTATLAAEALKANQKKGGKTAQSGTTKVQNAGQNNAKQSANGTTKQNDKSKTTSKNPAKETANPPARKPSIGMHFDATSKMFTKKQLGQFIKSIPVRMGEEYYIVLDNCSDKGSGHTIKVSVHVNAYEPLVLFYDKKAKRYTDVDLMILEKTGQGGERPIVQEANFKGGRVKFVPGFSYTLYAKRDGYFSIFREFNSADLMQRDTIMLFNMERIEKGSSFPITNVYFEDGEATLIGDYDAVLMDYVAMFRNHPDVTFLVKGWLNTYGVDAEKDMLLSLERAKTVKDYFVKNGISADRITTAGMTKNEISRAAAAALDNKASLTPVRIELIITGKAAQK